jgi:formaldehyde-activating enzyme involved in methanogenesis
MTTATEPITVTTHHPEMMQRTQKLYPQSWQAVVQAIAEHCREDLVRVEWRSDWVHSVGSWRVTIATRDGEPMREVCEDRARVLREALAGIDAMVGVVHAWS